MVESEGARAAITPADEQARGSRDLWNARLRGNPDEASVGCAGFGRLYNRWLYRVRAHVFHRVVRRLGLDAEELRVLDVGSGTGFYVEQWRRLGVAEVEGLDFSTDGVAYLRRRFPGLRVHLADLADPGFDPGGRRFDVISAFDILFHIVDDARYRAALNNLGTCLKPGGVLLLSENFVHRQRPRVSDYHYSRTLAEIERNMMDADLILERRYPMFVLMNAPDDSVRPAMRLWWRVVSSVACRNEALGWLAGACLYPFERILVSWLREGPSTELAVCCRAAPNRTLIGPGGAG